MQLHFFAFQTYLSVFVLNGYEEIANLQDMTDADLDYLGIKDPEHRERILELASLIKMQQEGNIKLLIVI